jgi:hypothetical protein
VRSARLSLPSDQDALDRLATLLPAFSQTLFLRCCLHEGDSADEAWTRWQDDATRDGTPLLRALAAYKAFLPLLSWNLGRNRIPLVPHLQTYFRFAHLTEGLRWRKYRAICHSALGGLRAAGIPFIVLKGAALSERTYPSPILRHTGDIDVLVREIDLFRAEALFVERMKWRRRRPATLPTRLGHQLPQLVDASGLPLELHRRLLVPYYTIPHDDLWIRSRPAVITGVEARILSSADTLLHVCAHAMANGRILRWVPDAWFVLQQQPSVDWSDFCSASTSSRLDLPLFLTLRYLTGEMGVDIPPDVLDRLRAGAHRTGRRGRYAALVGTRAWPQGTVGEIWRGPGSAWTRVKLLWRRVFPPPRQVALIYGLWPWQLPVYYLYRLVGYARRCSRTGAGAD